MAMREGEEMMHNIDHRAKCKNTFCLWALTHLTVETRGTATRKTLCPISVLSVSIIFICSISCLFWITPSLYVYQYLFYKYNLNNLSNKYLTIKSIYSSDRCSWLGKIQLWMSSPVPSGIDRTNVGSIFSEAVALVSLPSPSTSSVLNRCMMSNSVSSENRMEYRYLSIWKYTSERLWTFV